MADKDVPRLTPPSQEDLAVAARHFEYANRAAVGGNHDIAIQMLQSSCALVPGNLSYRQALRKVEKAKYKDNKTGSSLAQVTNILTKAQMHSALKAKDYKKALDLGEAALARNPWDKEAHIAMAQAAARLDLPVVAVWLLQDLRETFPRSVELNRALAKLLEEQKLFAQAMTLWEMIRRERPTDTEAQNKIKQMAVDDTLARGQLENSTAELAALPAREGGKTPAPPSRATPAVQRAQQELESLRSRIEKDPTRRDLYLQLATAHRRAGRLGEAQTVLQQGLAATDNHPELAFALADLEIEPYRRKLAQVEEQLKAAPGDEELRKTRDKVVRKLNKLELGVFEKKALQDPGDRPARFEVGVRRFRAGLVQEAIPELQAARADAKLHWQAALYLGRCFKELRNWPLAQRNYEEALKHIPAGEEAQRKELLFDLAASHAEAGDYERAVALAIDLADLDYGYRDIGQLMGQWQAKLAQGGSRPVKQP